MLNSNYIVNPKEIIIDLSFNYNNILLIKSENNLNFKINKKEGIQLYNSLNNLPWSKAWEHISFQIKNFILKKNNFNILYLTMYQYQYLYNLFFYSNHYLQ